MTGAQERVRVGATELEVLRFDGPVADAPTVVFLHEGLGSVAMWGDVPRAVCERLGWPGLVYSRAGYGRSDPAPLPWPSTFLDDEAYTVLPALLDAEGIERSMLFGHSDGASIALLAAAELGDRVVAMVVEAPHVLIEPCTLAGIRDARSAYDDGKLGRVLARYHHDADAAFRGWSDVWLSDTFAGWDITDRLAAITVPTLVIQGLDDQYGTVAQVDAIAAASSGPVERLVLDACGHSPHRDRFDVVLASVAAFVRDQVTMQPPTAT